MPQVSGKLLNVSRNGAETLEGTHHILNILLNRLKLPHNGGFSGKEQVSFPIAIITHASISCE